MGPGALAIVLFGAWWVVLAIVVDPLVGAVMAAVMLLLDPYLPLDPTRDWLSAMPGWHV